MTNIFISDISPIKSGYNLDNKRLTRMAYEAYDAVCGAVITLDVGAGNATPTDYPAPYAPGVWRRRSHVLRWVGEDRAHAFWTIRHAHACAREHARRQGQIELCLADRKCYEWCLNQLHRFPSHYRTGEPLRFYLAANHDWWRAEPSFREGRALLPTSAPVWERYRYSLLHKWLYLDARPPRWGYRGPPDWSLEPQRGQLLLRHLGPPKNHTPELRLYREL